MLLWVTICVLAAAAMAIVGRPLLWPPATSGDGRVPADPRAGIREVYKDQLAEIDADVARNLIEPAEAAAARLELSRRLLAQAGDERASKSPVVTPRGVPPEARALILAGVPLLALALYAALGTPDQPGRPTEQQLTRDARKPRTSSPDIEQLVAKVEARLRATPEDGRGWDVIAPVYLKLGRLEEAQAAFARAIELLGETPARLAGFADASIRGKDGVVSNEARAALEKVLKAEPAHIEARFWLALAHEQRGELALAADAYRALLASAPTDAPWRGGVAERLAGVVATSGNGTEVSASARGPSAGDVAAAAELTPEARQQMITGMVGTLHTRLKADGRDAAGWQRLLRAYGVLGDLPKAQQALAEARRALAGDQAALGAIDALAQEMGLGS